MLPEVSVRTAGGRLYSTLGRCFVHFLTWDRPCRFAKHRKTEIFARSFLRVTCVLGRGTAGSFAVLLCSPAAGGQTFTVCRCVRSTNRRLGVPETAKTGRVVLPVGRSSGPSCLPRADLSGIFRSAGLRLVSSPRPHPTDRLAALPPEGYQELR